MELTPKTRKETFLAAAAGQDVTTPTPITREEVFLDAIAKAGGGGGEKFLVTLTPTALDFSGTMDKTVAEINAAYDAGKEIWFRVYSGTSYSDVPLARFGNDGSTYPSFNANFLYDESDVLVLIYTGTTNDGTKQTYSTKVYALTPVS